MIIDMLNCLQRDSWNAPEFLEDTDPLLSLSADLDPRFEKREFRIF